MNVSVNHETGLHGQRNVQIDIELKSTASPIKKWLHEYPTVQNTATVALGILGTKTLYEGVKNYSFYSTVIGAALVGGSYLLKKGLPIFIPPAHDPSKKLFKEDECRGVCLVYQGNLPILTIPKQVTPYDAGYARGYMMAAQIKDLVEQNDFALHTVRGLPRQIPDLINKIKQVVPAEYIQEIEGLVAGYNAKRETWKFLKGKELTFDDVMYFHLLPDGGHIDFKEANKWAQSLKDDPMGCTVVIDGDATTGPRAIRTIDWLALDGNGKYAFVEQRETYNGMRTVGQSCPLLIGFLTAMNEHGLFAAMNVAKGCTDYPEDMPAIFYLRKLVETCSSVKGEQGAEHFWLNNSPLGPFNLSVLDEKDAVSVHFYQGEHEGHYVRWWKPDSQLVTLNFRYGEKGETNPTITNSRERKNEIALYYKSLHEQGKYKNTDSSERVKGILKGEEVNNIRTISAAYIEPKKRIFETSFDNGYAADRPLLKIPTEEWFSRSHTQ